MRSQILAAAVAVAVFSGVGAVHAQTTPNQLAPAQKSQGVTGESTVTQPNGVPGKTSDSMAISRPLGGATGPTNSPSGTADAEGRPTNRPETGSVGTTNGNVQQPTKQQ
ncbi:MAG: hypothetical protein JWO51_831 [Rhodospirillales bacterium]|nr:hypothetical protein [Rhodospirillales bacterium]